MIRVHIWHPIATPLDSVIDWARSDVFRRWGHAGLEIRDGDSGASEYYAFWPVDAPDLSVPVHGRLITSMDFDIREERGRPNRVVTLAPAMNESDVRAYWARIARTLPTYHYRDFNCCEAVYRAVRAGLPTDRGPAPAYLPVTPMLSLPVAVTFSTPYSVERWLDTVNRWLADPLLAPLEFPDPVTPPHPSWSRW